MKKNRKKGKTLYSILIVLFLLLLSFSLWKLLSALNEYRHCREYYSTAADSYTADSDGAAPISVDFDALCEHNSEIIGWIYSEGTEINYPILQADDNNKYLHRSPDGSYLYAGSIYADYRSVPAFSCANTLLYGHHMKDGSMFCSIAEYKNADYYAAHPELWIITPDGSYRARVIAGMTVNADDGVYSSLDSEAAVSENVRRFIAGSSFISNYEWSAGTPVLTLSTCTYEFDGARYVLICALEQA